MDKMICPLAQVEEVFMTAHGAVYQCSRQNCYWLDFQGQTSAFKVADFFNFKKRIEGIDIDAMLNDASRSCDYEVIMPFRSERCFVLSVADVLNLRELLRGARFMIELNGVVNSCLKRCPAPVFVS